MVAARVGSAAKSGRRGIGAGEHNLPGAPFRQHQRVFFGFLRSGEVTVLRVGEFDAAASSVGGCECGQLLQPKAGDS